MVSGETDSRTCSSLRSGAAETDRSTQVSKAIRSRTLVAAEGIGSIIIGNQNDTKIRLACQCNASPEPDLWPGDSGRGRCVFASSREDHEDSNHGEAVAGFRWLFVARYRAIRKDHRQ